MDDNNPPPPPPPHQQPQPGSRNEEQTPRPSTPSSEPASKDPSISSRIQESASGLLQNTLSGPSSRSIANDIASTLATGLGWSNKGSFPSSTHAQLQGGSSASGSIPHSHGLNLGQPSGRAGGDQRFPSESFRSVQSPATSNIPGEDSRAWEQFNHPTQSNTSTNNNEAFLLGPYDLSSAKGKGKLITEEADLDPTSTSATPSNLRQNVRDNFDSAWHNSSLPNPTQNQKNNEYHNTPHKSPHTSYTPHPNDGQAVISLLTSPSFQPATFTPPESPQSELFELDASMLPPSSSNQSTAATAATAATTTTTTGTITQLQTPSFPPNQLSLIPDIESILSAIQQQSHHPQQQHDWDWAEMPGVAEWLEIDGTYQDTVWGFLKPYVEAARREVVEQRDRGLVEVEDGPAVKRLGMVLGHLRARL
ncbi:hypothetical protein AJ78_06289 [Emergomyces pasteurianus Ep9510]|uniref:Uncharacterized protein n=1 Tax=Emergomyces pasteurianus Ep9510 TaxID=1447872 RepID=A0A1J9PB98_9EURO|nr:hypothetical protein AJ78_06289 [Emergomyces pasteurianus Ep9510]